jgi:DNA invertase Pin-like site-specific DNA recombinase
LWERRLVVIGYARVSTSDQKLDLQRDELKRAGCRKLFTDVASGARDRPGRAEALAYARKGDTIVVWKLDRFGRSLVDLVQTMQQLRERGVGFRSLHESIDTTTSGGRLIFHMFSALAEFERDLIRERTMAGLAAARARGRKGGRKPVLNADQEALLRKLAADRNNTPAFICATLGISRTSFYRYLAKPKPAALPPAAASSPPAPARTKRAGRKRSTKPAQRAAGAAAKSYSKPRRKPGRRGP